MARIDVKIQLDPEIKKEAENLFDVSIAELIFF